MSSSSKNYNAMFGRPKQLEIGLNKAIEAGGLTNVVANVAIKTPHIVEILVRHKLHYAVSQFHLYVDHWKMVGYQGMTPDPSKLEAWEDVFKASRTVCKSLEYTQQCRGVTAEEAMIHSQLSHCYIFDKVTLIEDEDMKLKPGRKAMLTQIYERGGRVAIISNESHIGKLMSLSNDVDSVQLAIKQTEQELLGVAQIITETTGFSIVPVVATLAWQNPDNHNWHEPIDIPERPHWMLATQDATNKSCPTMPDYVRWVWGDISANQCAVIGHDVADSRVTTVGGYRYYTDDHFFQCETVPPSGRWD